jgi:DNA (cytosine-5)-methyltransferase 1
MRAVLLELEALGYRWAYRLVDSRGFGLPQRRLRVVILASRGEIDPSDILFSRSVEPKFDDAIVEPDPHSVYGFYWTEGSRGVGWAKDAVPTIKGGSGLGIPSPPAVYDPQSGWTGTISLTDAERLQGFPVGWTAVDVGTRPAKPGERWKMLGNAVSVPLSRWIGEELASPSSHGSELPGVPFAQGPLPNAARGKAGRWERVASTTHVSTSEHEPLAQFLREELKPLSAKALAGYISRVESGRKKLPASFVRDLKIQLMATA